MRTIDLLGHPATPLAAIVVGVVLLLLGRRLFWVFVGLVGFLAGWQLAPGILHVHEAGVRLIVALAGGLVGVLLAVFIQKLAIALAGFCVGAYALANLMGWHLQHLSSEQQIFVLLAGVVAAIVAVLLFDLALVVLTSLAGAGLILDGLGVRIHGTMRPVLLIVLVIVGIAFQTRLIAAHPPHSRWR